MPTICHGPGRGVGVGVHKAVGALMIGAAAVNVTAGGMSALAEQLHRRQAPINIQKNWAVRFVSKFNHPNKVINPIIIQSEPQSEVTGYIYRILLGLIKTFSNFIFLQK